MDIDNLIRMANRIGDFFEAMPDADEARDGIAQHLKRFWEPRMRSELVAHVDAGGASKLKPIVMEAIRRHRATLIGRGAGIPSPRSRGEGQGEGQ
jgi:formate dehydrogenase subunit delta